MHLWLTRNRLKVPKRPKAIAILSGSSSSLPPGKRGKIIFEPNVECNDNYFCPIIFRSRQKLYFSVIVLEGNIWLLSYIVGRKVFLWLLYWRLFLSLSGCGCAATSYEALGTKALVTSSSSSSSSSYFSSFYYSSSSTTSYSSSISPSFPCFPQISVFFLSNTCFLLLLGSDSQVQKVLYL